MGPSVTLPPWALKVGPVLVPSIVPRQGSTPPLLEELHTPVTLASSLTYSIFPLTSPIKILSETASKVGLLKLLLADASRPTFARHLGRRAIKDASEFMQKSGVITNIKRVSRVVVKRR